MIFLLGHLCWLFAPQNQSHVVMSEWCCRKEGAEGLPYSHTHCPPPPFVLLLHICQHWHRENSQSPPFILLPPPLLHFPIFRLNPLFYCRKKGLEGVFSQKKGRKHFSQSFLESHVHFSAVHCSAHYTLVRLLKNTMKSCFRCLKSSEAHIFACTIRNQLQNLCTIHVPQILFSSIGKRTEEIKTFPFSGRRRM